MKRFFTQKKGLLLLRLTRAAVVVICCVRYADAFPAALAAAVMADGALVEEHSWREQRVATKTPQKPKGGGMPGTHQQQHHQVYIYTQRCRIFQRIRIWGMLHNKHTRARHRRLFQVQDF